MSDTKTDTIYLTAETLATVVGGSTHRADRLSHRTSKKPTRRTSNKVPRYYGGGVGRSSPGGIGGFSP